MFDNNGQVDKECQQNIDKQSETDSQIPTRRRDILKGAAGIPLISTNSLSKNLSSANSDTNPDTGFSELWNLSLPHSNRTIVTAVDSDGDGVDELAVGNIGSRGPSKYGIVKEGEYVWEESSSAVVFPDQIGDIDGDGNPEVVFRSKVSEVWVRPYTHNGEYLWSGDHGDWPDGALVSDIDSDGLAEVLALSNNRGDLSHWDDDGTVLWRTQDAALLESPFGFADIDNDNRGEVLVNQPPDESKQGLQVVQQSDTGGAEVLWSYGPQEPVFTAFANTEPNTEPTVLAAYLETGEVHAVDAEGSELWTVQTNLSDANAVMTNVVGGNTIDPIVWKGSDVVVVNGDTQAITEFTFSSPIQDISKFMEDQLLLVTDKSLTIVNTDGETLISQTINRQPKDIALGDFNGNGQLEVGIAFDDELVIYDTTLSETPSNRAPTAEFTYSPDSPETSQTVTFDATQSRDPDGSLLNYHWDFDHDETFEKTGQTVKHVFAVPREQHVTLRVTDDRGATGITSKQFTTPIHRGPEKKELAGRIDSISTTELNDKERVTETIAKLERDVRNHNTELQAAEDCVNRLRYTEFVTEAVLEPLGPEETTGTENNLPRELAKPVILTTLEILVGAYTSGGSTSALDDTITKSDLVTTAAESSAFRLLDEFLGSAEEVKTEANKRCRISARECSEKILQGELDTADEISECIEAAAESILDTIADSLRYYVEQNVSVEPPRPVRTTIESNSIQSTLNYTLANLDSVAAENGLNGSTRDARIAKEQKISDVEYQVEVTNELINQLEIKKEFLSDINTSVRGIVDSSPLLYATNFDEEVALYTQLATGTATSILDAVEAGAGIMTLTNLNNDHAMAAYLIVNGITIQDLDTNQVEVDSL